MAITLDGDASAYIQKTSGGDLQFTLTGFNNLPSSTSFSATNSYLMFQCSMIYPSGMTEGVSIEDIEVDVRWDNVTVTGDGDIVALFQLSRLDELTYNSGDVYGTIDNDYYALYAYGEEPAPTTSEWTGGHYLDWQNAVQMRQSRYMPISGGTSGGIKLLFKDSGNSTVETWNNWNNGLKLTRTNGPGGGALNTGTNFTYSGLSVATSSGGAAGDPHIKMFDGDRYTL